MPKGMLLKSDAFAWLLFTLLAIFVSGWARARLGGNTNSLIPAYAFLCLLPSLVLSETAIFHYKQSTYYNRAGQFTVLWSDPSLKIWWPVADPIVSRRDAGVSAA